MNQLPPEPKEIPPETYAEAEDLCLDVLNAEPEHHEARLLLAAIRLAAGDAENARYDIEALAEEDPDDLQVQLYLARLEEHDNRTGHAVKVLENCLRLDPDNGPASFLLGKICLQSGRFDQAVDVFRGVLAVPDLGRKARVYLVASLISSERFFEAEETLKKIPKNPRLRALYYRLKGDLAHRRKDYQESVDLYRAALDTLGEEVDAGEELTRDVATIEKVELHDLLEQVLPTLKA